MNKDTINIDGQTYVKQGSEATPLSPPSTLKVQGAKMVTRIINLVILIPLIILFGAFLKITGSTSDMLFLLCIVVSMCIARYLAIFIATKIFGESVMRNIPPESGNNFNPSNSSANSNTSGFYYGSSADADLGNLNYHDRR